ncbi:MULTISPECIES: ATP-binding protein [unclassified Leptolyngbya]|uniref:sensor histidine kinase n=1 Tax=unclassified Leptolyngbya TaxID=2650499 RepID=UPI0016820611|nr:MULTISPECIES: ATP-binding protein [unclassified Leptolyngbya]MBD1911313.1 HAMP domain-containing histidine kinase [Leptolyngbya sp. FACHB-8]MBD2156669.1 HAMP domain-containing histidine kinase [Leptolyngbya sp. FACHB-16]
MIPDSVRISPQFKALRWRLLLSSLGVIGGTLAAFGAVVHHVVALNLEQQSDHDLSLLADAAAHSLPDILASRHTSIPASILDNDGDLDISWQKLQQEHQAVEWFDTQGQLVGQSGNPLLTIPFKPLQQQSTNTRKNENEDDAAAGQDIDGDGTLDGLIHQLTVPVYSEARTKTKPVLQGYVRVSALDGEIAAELKRLRSGLQWGSLLALGLSAVGGWWLVRQSLQPIEASMQQLKQFTADASHELRTPLTVIKTSVDVIQSHPERVDVADLPKLEAIASATRQMSQLVDDLLWLTRSDQITDNQSTALTFPIDELLEEVVDQYAPEAEQRCITFKAVLQADTMVYGDPYSLKRLMTNLVTNALYYTPKGGTVTLSSQEEHNWVVINVQDTGIGIAAESLPFVFDRFWRADQARAQREEGSGLGLAIAQAIANCHSGEITVTSEQGKGSCFQVTLPTA